MGYKNTRKAKNQKPPSPIVVRWSRDDLELVLLTQLEVRRHDNAQRKTGFSEVCIAPFVAHVVARSQQFAVESENYAVEHEEEKT